MSSARRTGSLPLLTVITAVLALSLAPGPADAGAGPVAPSDVNCSGATDTVDALALLRFSAGLEFNQTQPCPSVGDRVGLQTFGDTDCDGDVDTVDALAILRAVAGIAQIEECTVQQLLVRRVYGVDLLISVASGPSFPQSHPLWSDAFARLGLSENDIDLAVATPPPAENLRFQMAVIRTRGLDWAERIDTLVQRVGPPGQAVVLFETLLLAGRTVLRAHHATDPSLVPVYYHSFDDVLVYIQSNDEVLVRGIIQRLPTSSNPNALTTGYAAAPASPAETDLLLHILRAPQQPVCVGEPPGRQLVVAAAFDLNLIPSPFTIFLYRPSLSPARPANTGAALALNYTAEQWSADGESLSLQAFGAAGAFGEVFHSFPVRHCLNGTWEDGPRTLRITQDEDGAVSALIEGGSLGCGVAGPAFSGTLVGETLSGGDMKVCNPDECVEAGVLDLTALVPYTATVSPDGQSIQFQLERQLYEKQFDQRGAIVACNLVDTQPWTFDIERLTFGPDIP
jgi:hypothetical protein